MIVGEGLKSTIEATGICGAGPRKMRSTVGGLLYVMLSTKPHVVAHKHLAIGPLHCIVLVRANIGERGVIVAALLPITKVMHRC